MMTAVLKKVVSYSIFIAAMATGGSAYAKIDVIVSLGPQKYFVQQIGKDLVDIQVMIPPGADFHIYEPKPKQMVALARARLYFAIGIEFEEARLKDLSRTNPQLVVVRTDRGIEKMPLGSHHQFGPNETHAPETDADHDHDHHAAGGLDPHIWLSPPLVRKQAGTIVRALQEIDPDHHSIYQDNYQAFVAEIDELDAELKTVFAGRRGLQFMVFHPAWGYFAHAYGLQQLPVEIEGKNPKPAQLRALIEHARENDIKVIFVQPQFSAKSAQLIAREIGGQVVIADPLAREWAANLRQVARQIKAQLR
ncbi:Zinc ABC transporter, substrate-binding protein ZnuA [Olavius algarvensis Delta 1 endosymbiont]|nr:Zinc ABC transporter, substrate-binding protein ZnuA [Olavius algarvensis Delta 1 endosymbiont]